MKNNAQHGDVRYLMIFVYLPTWINGKFYFWEHYFIKQKFCISYDYVSGPESNWYTIPINIERWEYEIFKFGSTLRNTQKLC